jgi:integrase
MRVRYRYVIQDRDRHGNVRVYFWRRPGPKVRMHEPPGSEAFAARYQQLVNGPIATEPSSPERPALHSRRWLVAQYVAAPTFRDLDPSTQATYRRILEQCCLEPVKASDPNSPTVGRMPLARVTEHTLRHLRDRKRHLPGAASDRVKALRGLFAWAVDAEGTGVTINPALSIKYPRQKGGGHPTWSIEDVEAFERRHPIGTMARLALALLLYTGIRRSDVVQLGRQQVRRGPVEVTRGIVYPGWISKPQWKGRRRHPHRIEIPLLQALADIIDATVASGTSAGGLAYLLGEHGRPYAIRSFGNWFSDRCAEAGLVLRSAHGLRKATSTRAAEGGASAHELMAIFGWKTLKEAELYTRAADRKRLAAEGMAKGLAGHVKNEIVPTMTLGEDKRAKKT